MATLVAHLSSPHEKKRPLKSTHTEPAEHETKRMKLCSTANPKLEQFQQEPLEDSVNYMALQSSLALLQSRLKQLKGDMKELASLKQCIRETSSVKEAAALIHNNQSYLQEIQYRGCVIKCPEIDWLRDYDVEMDCLLAGNDLTHKITDRYEILKRDRLFN